MNRYISLSKVFSRTFLLIIVVLYIIGISVAAKGEAILESSRPEVRILPSNTEKGGIDAYITWTTNERTRGEVVYGLTPEYGFKEFEMSSTFYPNLNHRIIIESLEEGKEYYFRILGSDAKGNTFKSDEYTFIAELPAYKDGSATKEYITLYVQEKVGLNRIGEPARGGIPFPEGKITSLDNMRVVDSKGDEMLSQFQDLARWPDGSIKWVLVQFECDLNASKRGEYRLEYGTEVSRQVKDQSKLIVKDDENSIYINTGAISFSISKDKPKLLEELMVNGKPIIDSNVDFVVRDMANKVYSISESELEEIVVEEDGPIRAVIRLKGKHADGQGNEFFEYLVRMYLYKGRPEVRFSYTFMNNYEDVKPVNGLYGNYVKNIDLVIPLQETNALEYVLSGDKNVYSGKVQNSTEKIELLQYLPKEYIVNSGDKKIGSGKANEGWVYVGAGDKAWGILAYVDNFWETYPKGLSISKEGLAVSVAPAIKTDRYGMNNLPTTDYWKNESTARYWYLRDDGYFIPQGVANTTDIVLSFYEHAGSVQDYREASGRYSNLLQIYAQPEWYASTQALGDFVIVQDTPLQEYESAVQKGFDNIQARRERMDEYGLLNYGDWNFWEKANNHQWGNTEYDLAYGLFFYFVRTGDYRYFERAEEAAIHFRDVDVVHYSNQPRRNVSPQYSTSIIIPGEVLTHNLAHSGYGESNMHGHVWLRGLVLHYYLTGDRYSLDTARLIGDVLASYSINSLLDDWMNRFPSERSPAWAVFGLTGIYKATGDEYYLNAAKIFIDNYLTKLDENGSWKRPLLRPGHCYHKDPQPACEGGVGFQAAIALSALAEYWEITGDERIPDSIVSIANWMIEDLWNPVSGAFRYTSCELTNYAPNTNPLYVHGLGYAYRFSEDEKFMKVAIQALKMGSKASAGRGKEYAMSLMTVPHFLYELAGYYEKINGAEKNKGVGLLQFFRR